MTAESPQFIESPDDPSLDRLCQTLAGWAGRWRSPADWPADSLAACASAGVFRWFLPESAGGMGWNDVDQTRGYLRLAAADLTTTFILTQFVGACRRIAGSDNPEPSRRWLPKLMDGSAFATVGISHLTTSRQHLAEPVMRVWEDPSVGGFRISGTAPWVTGAPRADVIVIAGTFDDGRELLAAVPVDHPSIEPGPGADLLALSGSCTDQVVLHDTPLSAEMVIAGPQADVMRSGVGAGTGGLQTSTLAIGVSRAAVDYLFHESTRRWELTPIAEKLAVETDELERRLLQAAVGEPCDATELRGTANRLVLRTTQAAMTAAKGAGFVTGHPAGRWCREALFFLVWSCPQLVASEQLCELAGIGAKIRP